MCPSIKADKIFGALRKHPKPKSAPTDKDIKFLIQKLIISYFMSLEHV